MTTTNVTPLRRVKIKSISNNVIIIFVLLIINIGLIITLSNNYTNQTTTAVGLHNVREVSTTIIKKKKHNDNNESNNNNNDESNSSSNILYNNGNNGGIYKNLNKHQYQKIYGHLHFPKTAGSSLNSLMASKYERVCGNKGYSYDSYQHNSRLLNQSLELLELDGRNNNNLKFGSAKGDMVSLAVELSTNHTGADRGKIPWQFVEEIGYEDCEYISGEISWKIWSDIVNKLQLKKYNMTLELHIPCHVDPIELFMSMKNHGPQRNKKIDCTKFTYNTTTTESTNSNHNHNHNHNNSNNTIITSINKMELKIVVTKVWLHKVNTDERFNNKLLTTPNINVKCFNPFPLDKYINVYMSDKLQKRRFPIPDSQYVNRITNRKHNKDNGCIRYQSNEVKQTLRQILIDKHPYIKFCNECMNMNNMNIGSSNNNNNNNNNNSNKTKNYNQLQL